MGNIATINLDKASFKEVDDIIVNANGAAGRITKADFLGAMNDWSTITNKPFDNFNNTYFRTTERDDGADILTLSDSVIAYFGKVDTLQTDLTALDTKVDENYTNLNTQITNSINSVSTYFGNQLSGVASRIDTLEGSSHTHDNKAVIDLFTVSDDTLFWNGTAVGSGQGLDFDALSTAMTTGTLSGIAITADSENSRFNFEVTGIPTIAIDSEGYWTIDGERGENPTKAQGERGTDGSDGVNGKDGASPTIDPTTKNWIVGTVDTGVKAEAQSNYFYTGTEFPTSDLIDGDLYLSFAEDTRGNVYQYQALTLDWSLQGNLYGGGAVIDDTSTSGNTVTWSASKINSVIGDINTILASVTGGIE